MYCNEDNEWKYIPVETADEIISCVDVIECKRLQNWNRWVKIRKQQHKNLGLKVCRSSTSLLMNKSDKFRSKVEKKWMADVAFKLKVNNEYNYDFPYSIMKEINNFTSVRIPDVIRGEKGLSSSEKCARFDLGKLTADNCIMMCDEIHTLQSLIPFESSEKLAVVGESIYNKTIKRKFEYRGPIPSICVETSPEDESISNDAIIVVRLNDFITKPIYKNSKCDTFKIETKSKPINVIKVNENQWDEIIIENRGQISFRYKWKKKEYIKTKYDCLLKERIECYYFDTRTNILGPGEIKRLPVLFNPKTIGPHREAWYFQVEILGKLDPVVIIQVPLQGCAILNIDRKTDVIKQQNYMVSEKMKILRNKSTNSANVQNALVEKYQYHDIKMKYLYRILQIDRSLSIDALLYQCMQLEQSFREKFLNLISQTAVTLLKKEIIFEHDQKTQRELNASKIMYIAIDCIDLIMNTYEPDFDEVCKESNRNLKEQKRLKLMKNSGNEVSLNSDAVEQTSDFSEVREDFLEMMKPMIYNRLEWSIERILDYDLQWTECKHQN